MKKPLVALSLGFILLCTWLVYSNHFNNAFHFDDQHTIVDNLYIRSLSNIPGFFTNAATTSTLPANQAYRPGLTTLNAIDFAMAGKPIPEPFVFHLSIFISYLLLGILCFFLFLHFLNSSKTSSSNTPIALFTTAWFLLHTANAETINYIIARSDSFSTLMVVLSFILYIYVPTSRKAYLYFLPCLLGYFVKEQTIMFVPMLFVYKLLFEQKLSVIEWFTKPTSLVKVIKQVVIPLLLAIFVFLLSRKLTPTTWESGGTDRWKYLFTQPFVLFHYVYNFVLPVNFVIDTDWKEITSYTDDRVAAGLLFIFALITLSFQTSHKAHTRPITFGLLWFFIALLPTSSIFPFAEVLNDHRPFFPYIGLFIASATLVRNMLSKYALFQNNAAILFIGIVGMLVLGFNAYGTYQRNKVWKTEESIWQEVTIKAPNNPRGWMNYGIALMARGDYANAEICYLKTTELSPNYSYAYINLGIAKGATGDPIAAEQFFKKALSLNSFVPEAYSLYARFLIDQGRKAEAKTLLDKGLSISPKHEKLLQMVEILNNNTNTVSDKLTLALEQTKKAPTAESFLELSLQYYNIGQFEKSIEAANQSLKYRPTYDLAYNNICAAYNRLRNWDKAIQAGEKGLQYNPTNQLLKGNLAEAYREKNKKL